MIDVPVILGTARKGRLSEGVADALLDLVKQKGWLTSRVDVADHPLEATSQDAPHLARYRERIAAADGFVIVAPEYNHGYPGELKLLLDSDFRAYRRKPVGLVGVSSGRLGGARMIAQLQAVVTALGMVPVTPTLLVPDVGSTVVDGRFATDGLHSVAENMLTEIEWFARALALARRSD